MNPTVLVVLVMVVLVILLFAIPVIRMRRAVRAVIAIFREKNATDAATAKAGSELGLNPKGFFERLFTVRDFKPYALKILIDAGIVRVTEDDKLFLSENALAGSEFTRLLPKP